MREGRESGPVQDERRRSLGGATRVRELLAVALVIVSFSAPPTHAEQGAGPQPIQLSAEQQAEVEAALQELADLGPPEKCSPEQYTQACEVVSKAALVDGAAVNSTLLEIAQKFSKGYTSGLCFEALDCLSERGMGSGELLDLASQELTDPLLSAYAIIVAARTPSSAVFDKLEEIESSAIHGKTLDAIEKARAVFDLEEACQASASIEAKCALLLPNASMGFRHPGAIDRGHRGFRHPVAIWARRELGELSEAYPGVVSSSLLAIRINLVRPGLSDHVRQHYDHSYWLFVSEHLGSDCQELIEQQIAAETEKEASGD